MSKRENSLAAICAAAATILLTCASLSARAADIVVYSSVAIKPVLAEIAPTFERESKHKLVMKFATAAELKAEIEKAEKGAACDVAILTAAGVDDLIKQGKVTAASRAPIAKSGIGMAIKSGSAAPAMATPDELKKALMNAKSIALTATGATGQIMKRIFEKLGISDAIAAKIVVITDKTAPEAVAIGQAEIGFTQLSEILSTPGATLAGPLPKELQVYSAFVGGVTTAARDGVAAQALMDYLTGSKITAVYVTKGLEQVAAK